MRILLVQPAVAPEKGGAQGVHAALAAGLAERGHEVHLVGEYERVPALWARLSSAGVTVHQKRLHQGGLGGAHWLRGLLRSLRPDIVQSALRPADVATAFANLGVGIPHVVLVQERLPTAADEAAPSGVKMAIHRLALRRATAVTGTSEFARAAATKFAGLDATRTGVIPNGIDLDRFTDPTIAPATIDGIPDSAPVILVVGRLSREKRPDLAIRVFEQVAEQHPTAWIVFVGDGTMRGQVERAATLSFAAGRIAILGARSNMPALYRRARVVLHLCAVEGFGLTPLEGMASGVPIVATKAGGVVDIVRQSVTGLLVPLGDNEVWELAESVIGLLHDSDSARRLGTAGRNVALHYSQERMVEAYDTLYVGLLHKRVAP